MNAVIKIYNIPDYQIGKMAQVYFPDSMQTSGKCELLKEQQPEIVRCKDCKYCVKEPNGELYCNILAVGYEPFGSKKVNSDWYCADGERNMNCSDNPNS